MSEATRERPWQLLLSGRDIGQIDAATRQALGADSRTLHRGRGIGGANHRRQGVNVTRDFPSDYTIQVDRLLAEIFKNNAAVVTGIEFLGLENPHTATPDNPFWSPQDKAYASIAEARARSEITPEDAIAAYRRLAAASK
jgi:hypothetical protein